MRLSFVLGLAAALTISSCQENKTTVQEPVRNVQGAAKDLSKEEFLSEVEKLSVRVEKALAVEVDNTKKAKRILTFVKESRLSTAENKKAVMKVMGEMALPIEEQKEIMYILDSQLPR